MAGVCAEQPPRLAPNPAVARKALAPRLNLSSPRRLKVGVTGRLVVIVIGPGRSVSE
ncbi:hypothetical protein D3C77_811130 [compost metagenome]